MVKFSFHFPKWKLFEIYDILRKKRREKKNIYILLHYICSALVDFVTEPTLDIEVFNQSGYE